MTGAPAPAPASGAAAPPFLAGRWPWFAILIAALVPRLLFVALAPNRWQYPDSREYEDMALSVYIHGTFGLHTLRSPGYPTLIAAVYLLFGPHLLPLRLVEAAIGVLSVGLIGVVGARLFGRTAGLISAALAALHPVLAFLPTIQYSENTLVLVVVLAFAAVFTALRRGDTWRWAVAGALWGVALLTRPNTMFALPGLAIGLLFALRRARRPWWAPAWIGLAACVLTVTPWILRNHRVHGEWYFISTGGGRQFWIGHNPRAEADSRVAGFVPDSVMEAETRALPNEVQRERYYYRKGYEYAREHPGRNAILYLREVRNLLAFYPETKTGQHINAWSRTSQGLASAVMFAGTLLALRRFRAEPVQWILLGSVVSFVLGSAIYFAIMRYRMAVEPCLLWMAGRGWDELLSRRIARRA
jgi:4-amino-4-deoxy-L-arabinose transferase-like glycosyltransferase